MAALAAAALLLHGGAARAQSHDHSHAQPQATSKAQKPWGLPGDVRAARRTIRIRMGDDMRYRPDEIEVGMGDTVRLVVTNEGKLPHEIVLGTRERLDEHAAEMAQASKRAHAHQDASMAEVKPGATKTIVWKFNRAGEFAFGCLIPGHYEAGMIGTIRVFAREEEGHKH